MQVISVQLINGLLSHHLGMLWLHHDCLHLRLTTCRHRRLDHHHGLLGSTRARHDHGLHVGRHCHLWLSIVLGHGGLRVGLRGVWVRVVGEHHALHAGCLCILAILHEHGLLLARLQHEVLVVALHLLEVLIDCLLGQFFLHVSNFAQVGAPSGQAKRYNSVEDNDVNDEPPVEKGDLLAALVLNATPQLELHKEHAAADEEVEAKEQFGDTLEARGHLHGLQKEKHKDDGPKEKDEARRRLQVCVRAVVSRDDQEHDAKEGEQQ